MAIKLNDYAFEYDLGLGNRIAVLETAYLMPAISKGFSREFAHIAILSKERELLTKPTKIFKGTNRKCFFDHQPDWWVADNIYAIVTKPRHNYVPLGCKIIETEPPQNSVFVVYLLEGIDRAIRDRWHEVLKLDDLPTGKICGYEWVKTTDDDPDTPKDAKNRYKDPVL